jgi:LPXTG-motif cell wall-anchored protein
MVLLALILTFGWAALAQAQVGSADDQYGNPAKIPTVTASDSGSASAASDSGSASAASGSALSATTLPSTGGASLIALGAGVLLVGGGLVARRMIR